MAKFKLVAFSEEIPTVFAVINGVILVPISVWPIIFYTTIFFFDDPYADPTYAQMLFFAVNLYPLYLFVLTELNARLYRKVKAAAYVLPTLVVAVLVLCIAKLFIV